MVKTSPLDFKRNKPGDRGFGPGDDRSVASEGLKVNLKFYSKSLKMDREVQIYLPQGYDQTGTMRYPVVYFLHGTAQNSYSEGELFSMVKNLISSKTISPLIMFNRLTYELASNTFVRIVSGFKALIFPHICVNFADPAFFTNFAGFHEFKKITEPLWYLKTWV